MLEKDFVKELLEIKIRFGKTISGVYSVKILRFRIRIHRAMLADEIGTLHLMLEKFLFSSLNMIQIS